MKFSIPYGSTKLSLELPDEKVAGVLESNIGNLKAEGTEDAIVQDAMNDPFGGVYLRDMAVGKKTATIIISDHTRPVPSKHIIPFMLKSLRDGNPDIDITLFVATGIRRLTVDDEL